MKFAALLLWSLAASPFTSMIMSEYTPSPLELYAFTSCDLYRTVHSLTNTLLVGDLTSPRPELLACDASGGMSVEDPTEESSSPYLESQYTLGSLQQHFNDTDPSGLTIALWITPALTTTTTMTHHQPILTLGSKVLHTVLPDDLSSTTGCPGYDFQLVQIYDEVLVSYTDGDPARSCRYRQVPYVTLPENETIHVAVTFDTSRTYIYMNSIGGRVLGPPNSFDTTLQHWNLADSSLQLFAAYASEVVFRGAIHQLDLFDQFLEGPQIAAVYEEGVSHDVASQEQVVVLATPQKHGNIIRQDARPATPLTLRLGSSNVTSAVLQLQVELLSLPRHGRLWTIADDELSAAVEVLTNNTRFPLALGESAVSVHYELTSNTSSEDTYDYFKYFNQPTVNAYGENLLLDPESFDFRVLAYDKNAQLLATSPSVQQNVYVVHVNHPPILLSVPEEAILDVVDPSNAFVVGIDFADDPRDRNLDRVRVDVWTSSSGAGGGELSLPQPFLPYADFESCRHRNWSSWQCVGDGNRDRSMTFVAFPDMIPLILHHLEYYSSSSDDSDEITIRVSDGAGGMCLEDAEHLQFQQQQQQQQQQSSSLWRDDDHHHHYNFTSIRDHCFQIEATVSVPSYSYNDTDTSGPSCKGLFGVCFLIWQKFLGLGVAMLIVIAMVKCFWCFFPSWLARKMARGTAIDVDDDDENSPPTATTTPKQDKTKKEGDRDDGGDDDSPKDGADADNKEEELETTTNEEV